MANQKLILEAELRDGITASLKKIQAQLNSIKETPGMSAANGWLSKLGKGASEFSEAGKGAVDVIGGMGIGGLAAAGSLAAMATQLKSFVASKSELSEMARQMQINVDVLNRFEKAGVHYQGVSEGAMDSLIRSLNDRLPEIRRKTGEMFKELSGMGYTDLRDRLAGGEDLPNAVMDVLKKAEQVGQKYGPRVQKQFLERMFPGNGDIAERIMGDGGVKGFEKQLGEVAKKLQPVSPAMVKAQQEFRDAQRDFNMALENFDNSVGPKFLHMIAKITEDLALLMGIATPEKKKELDQKDEDRRKAAAGAIQEHRDKVDSQQRKGGADDERARIEERNKALGIDKGGWFGGLAKKTSYEGGGSGGLLQTAAYFEDRSSSSGVSSSLQETIAGGTKTGVLAAFRELMAFKDGGIQNTSYEPGGGLGSGGGGGGGGGGRGGAGGDASAPGGPIPESTGRGNLSKLIDAEAKRAGIDPRILEGIRAGESGHSNRYDIGDKHDGGAYGPFQFNMGRGRFGDKFLHDTGKDPRDPKTIPDQVRYMSEFIARQLKKDPHYADGGNSSRLHAVWHGFHGLRTADPRWGDSGYNPPGAEGTADLKPGGGLPGDAVDRARQLLGMGSSEAATALGKSMHPGAWCADFVNGVLSSKGIKGSEHNSALAASFLRWGSEVATAAIKKGDVLVRRNGHHVGMAEGAPEMHNGRMMVHMISGNYSHKVSESWEDPNQMYARRATGLTPPSQVAGAGSVGHPGGKVDVHMHMHHDGTIKKHSIQSTGMVSASLHNMQRWPTMHEPADA